MQEKDENPAIQKTEIKKRGKGGRPRGNPENIRAKTIGVRVSGTEFLMIKAKSQAINVTPADWLRKAALTRRLPSPPVPAINREQYTELARLSANLNQLARLANGGQAVTVANELLQSLAGEVVLLRLALIGTGGAL